jgi:hypothetical protein
MKKLFLMGLAATLAVCGVSALEGGERGVDAQFLLSGMPLNEAEMDSVEGGLPRCCHDAEYDPIEDKCLNNKGQKYLKGENDCDIWVENVLSEAGYDIANRWGSARTTSVDGHMRILAAQLMENAPKGWSIEFIDRDHVTLIRVNSDGSADVYHQGYNYKTPTTEAWDGSRGYHYVDTNLHTWGERRRYWDFDR